MSIYCGNPNGNYPNFDAFKKEWGYGHLINRWRVNGANQFMGDGIYEIGSNPFTLDPDENPHKLLTNSGGLLVNKFKALIDGYDCQIAIQNIWINPIMAGTYYVHLCYLVTVDSTYPGSVSQVETSIVISTNFTTPPTITGSLVVGKFTSDGSAITALENYEWDLNLGFRRPPKFWFTKGAGLFGNGEDGDVVITSGVSLTKDMYYKSLVVGSGGTLSPNGHRIFSKEFVHLKDGGLILCCGQDGGVPTGGSG